MKQMFSVVPNKYIPKARGILSQLAYSKLFNRDAQYDISDGYLQNTLIVYLTVDEDDWNVRCDLSHEHELNKRRSDVEAQIKYKSSSEAFDYAYDALYKANPYKENMMKLNTSELTPYKIILEVKKRLEELNKQ